MNNILTQGKAKSILSTDNEKQVILDFKNDTSAFDGKKIQKLDNKGKVNNNFNFFIMQYLENNNIKTHIIEKLDSTKSLVKKLEMFKIECVVRNFAAGSICKRLGLTEGIELTPPTFEFFLKNDPLGDPMLNSSLIKTLKLANQEQINEMQELSLKINNLLSKLFLDKNIILVDYKLEFGIYENQMLLGDEFTPDGCRLWDKDTKEKLDKDRFRQNLGSVVDSYVEVANRLGVKIS